MAKSRVLVIGETTFPFHNFDEIAPLFENVLSDHVDLTLTTDRDMLTDLSEYDVLVDYLTDSSLTENQLDGLLSFVKEGNGYVGVHCASDLTNVASDDPDELLDSREQPVPELRELLGGHFITHPEQAEFAVRITDHDHPITADVEDFVTFDEPYQVEYDDDVRVIATMDHPDLEAYPVAWVKTYGEGRVFYLSLGHTDDVFDSDPFETILSNGIEWAA
ncbi:ThuA domain-containing protein [Haladaptatus sp. CMAA 1911]|uniref:ThuA domain-containing protein n=1 Tax=unclassified Haladaptatus TaxID=2622732 RepID=UPI003754A09F